ncbi:unnamed protein product [Closterium sp. NIES-54]
MDAEMASWKSTGTYVDEAPPHGANIVDGMWIFRVKRPSGSPPAFKARYVARGFSQRQGVDYFQNFSPTPKMTTLRVFLHVAAQRDYDLHSLDFSTAFLQGNLHEEIWLRRPPGFTESFPAGTQWSLRRQVYGLHQAPREWHDTLRTTLAALGSVPTTADPSLFLRHDTSLPPFYVLVYVNDLVFATADTEAMALVQSELQKRHTCTDLDELRGYLGLQITRDRAQRTITLTQSHMVHQSVEPSGPYLELVGFLMYLMTCTRLDLTYPLSLLACCVAPGRHRKVHWDAAKRVLRYLCSTSGMGLVLGGRGPVVLTGHADALWELRWLTYLLIDLGEQPRSPLVLYVDNKAIIALCQEHRLEHRTKHIVLRYFLARELQQRGQLRLAYVATRANTADIFTKALPPGDHQRFSTVLGLGFTLTARSSAAHSHRRRFLRRPFRRPYLRRCSSAARSSAAHSSAACSSAARFSTACSSAARSAAAHAPLRPMPASDPGAGAPMPSSISPMPASNPGAGVPMPSPISPTPASDPGAGAPMPSPISPTPASDLGAGAPMPSSISPVPAFDRGARAPMPSSISPMPASDPGAGAPMPSSISPMPGSDPGAWSPMPSSISPMPAFDLGAGAPMPSSISLMPASDPGAGAPMPSPISPMPASDPGADGPNPPIPPSPLQPISPPPIVKH